MQQITRALGGGRAAAFDGIGEVARRRARQHCPHERENDGLIKACHLLQFEIGCFGSGVIQLMREIDFRALVLGCKEQTECPGTANPHRL